MVSVCTVSVEASSDEQAAVMKLHRIKTGRMVFLVNCVPLRLQREDASGFFPVAQVALFLRRTELDRLHYARTLTGLV